MECFKQAGQQRDNNMVTDHIQNAIGLLKDAIIELRRFVVDAQPQSTEAEDNVNAIDYVADELQAFVDKHESLFDEIGG